MPRNKGDRFILSAITQYRYDALNRLTLKHFPADSTQDIGYVYDEAPAVTPTEQTVHAGSGLLTHTTDQAGGDYYTYDDRGNLIKQSRHTAYALHQSDNNVEYQWDLADRLTTLTYPSGLSVNYQRNTAGQVTDVSYHLGANPDQMIVSDITYQPFGDVQALTWGNGLELTRAFDQDGRLIQQNTSFLTTLDYVYDPVGNIITQSTDGTDSPFEYDALNRLTSEQSIFGPQQYLYDEVGNRIERIREVELKDGSIRTKHQRSTYAEESNRLATLYRKPVLHDENGSTASGTRANQYYRYNLNNRYSEFKRNNVTQAQYFYNAQGERVLKKRPPSFVARQYTLFTYSTDGQLLSEAWYSDARLIAINHYLWLDQLPLAFIKVRYNKNSKARIRQLAYIHSDHLNTPRLATNDEQTTVWRWTSDAFGLGKTEKNPDGDSIKTKIGLRFPGQYYDTESGLHYNYYRDYDPRTGRYVQSDPIGLAGGLNTYAYVSSNPLIYSDPQGLLACGGFCVGAVIIGGKALIGAATTYVASKATGNDDSTAAKQAAVSAVFSAATAPGAGMLVNSGKNAYVVATGQAALGNTTSQLLLTGKVDPLQTAIAGTGAIPALAVENAALRLGIQELSANAAGSVFGATFDGLGNETINRWHTQNDADAGMCRLR